MIINIIIYINMMLILLFTLSSATALRVVDFLVLDINGQIVINLLEFFITIRVYSY